MPVFALKYSANLTGLQSIAPSREETFFATMKCCRCNETTSKPPSFELGEEHEMSGSRGTAHLVQSCKFCKTEFSASIIPAQSFEALDAEKHEHESATLIVLDCRGCEPVSSSLEGLGFTGTTKDGEEVEIVLEEEAEWYGATDAGDELAVADTTSNWVHEAGVGGGHKGKGKGKK